MVTNPAAKKTANQARQPATQVEQQAPMSAKTSALDRARSDVLDATKLIPEELAPVTPVGRMVLNRNPDNFFAETEQVAFCTAHVVPGIDFSNDPLLAGRIHSYIDTQITRLGGANIHEIRERMPSSLVNVSAELAATVATGLGMALPKAMPRVLAQPATPELSLSAALSLTALPGDGGIRSRSIAFLVADGVDGESIAAVRTALQAVGAKVHMSAPRLGSVKPVTGKPLDATGTLENSAPVLFDALVLPDGAAGVKVLGRHVEVMDFISNQHRHGKTIFAIGASGGLLERVGVPAMLPGGQADPGVLMAAATEVEHAVTAFITALGRYRHPERELALTAR